MNAPKELTLNSFKTDDLGENKYSNPLKLPEYYFSYSKKRVIYNNVLDEDENLTKVNVLSFERAGPFNKVHFDSNINAGIVTCGGLCPGLNDVIRSVTFGCLKSYGIKTVYGFKNGYEGLTSGHYQDAIILDPDKVDNIHETGGTILGSSRGPQSPEDMVDTLVKLNISIMFVIGGDGTQHGAMVIGEEIKKRELDIAVVGIPKTIDNDISFVHRTFGFLTAVEEARKAIDAAHVEAKGTRNGIGMVKLMGRHSGYIAAHATLGSGNVNICLIPEAPLDLNELYQKIEKRFEKSDHLVIVVAEGVGQDLLYEGKEKEYDASGNVKLQDIGIFLKKKITEHLKSKDIKHTIRYIDPSYMIRSTPANAADSSFCLRLGNFAVHAAMAGKTNTLVGYWNQHFTLTPIKLAISHKKTIRVQSSLWETISEITI